MYVVYLIFSSDSTPDPLYKATSNSHPARLTSACEDCDELTTSHRWPSVLADNFLYEETFPWPNIAEVVASRHSTDHEDAFHSFRAYMLFHKCNAYGGPCNPTSLFSLHMHFGHTGLPMINKKNQNVCVVSHYSGMLTCLGILQCSTDNQCVGITWCLCDNVTKTLQFL